MPLPSTQAPKKLKTDAEKISYINNLLENKIDHVHIRKEVGRIWNIGKSARNEKFNKMVKNVKMMKSGSVKTGGANTPSVKAKTKNPAAVKINGDKAVAEVKGVAGIVTVADLIAYAQIDMSVWEPIKFFANCYNEIWQVKAEFKKKVVEQNCAKLLEKFIEEADHFAPLKFVFQTPSKDRDCLYVLNIQDLHLSKLGWHKETNTDYDISIAKEVFTNAVNDLMKKAPKERIEEVIVICGSDFFQCDKEGMTTAGTVVDTDSRLSKTFEEGINLLTSTIEKLAQNHKVRVMCYSGNHDASISLYAGYYISAWFKNNTNVVVDNGPKTRKYYGYGKTLLTFVHGNEEKSSDIPLIIMRENMETISKYKYIECLSGHFHAEGTVEKNGVKLRTASSLSGNDAWHAKKGFVGNIRTSQGLLYSKEQGIEAIYYSNPV